MSSKLVYLYTETSADLISGEFSEPGARRDYLEASEEEMNRQKGCQRTVWVRKHEDCGAHVGSPDRCKSKWCPTCLDVWAKKARRQLLFLTRTWKHYRMVVLTARNVDTGNLKQFHKQFQGAFRRLRQRKIWKDNVWEAYSFIGLTFNAKARTWHYHRHLIVDSDFLQKEAFQDAWNDCARREGLIVDRSTKITRNDKNGNPYTLESMIDEALKGTKGDMDKLHKQFRELPYGRFLMGEALTALKGVPWFRPMAGAVSETRDATGKDGLLVEKKYCPRCGAEYRKEEWETVAFEDKLGTAWPMHRYLQDLKFGGHWHSTYTGFVTDPQLSETFFPESSPRVAAPPSRVQGEFRYTFENG